jgi:ribonuclease BN (tRNA processing enzyme)
LIRAGQAGLHVEDAMNTYHGYPRFARECKDRDWGYRLRLAQRQLGDIKIAFSPTTFCVESLHEDHIYGLIDGATSATQALFARFAANGDASSQAQTGLPPGFSRR